MPRTSRRQRFYKLTKRLFFNSLKGRMLWNIFDGGTTANDSDDSEINFFAIFFFRTMNNRYLDRPLAYATNSYIMIDSVFEMSDTSFLLHFRMEKESFQLLVNEVKDYHEFIQRRGPHGNLYRKKAPVSYQLLVFLYVCGAVGSDANFKKVASRFKISHGLVQIFVERCTRALKSKLEVDTINWPDANERRIISKRFQDKYGFANCIGLVDGTVFPLVFKPTEYGEDYWYRKGGYAIHSLIICDDEMRILDYLVGYPGSVHDNRVWSKTDQCNHYYNYFSRLQYLLADSAFTTSVHLIAAFKRLRGVCVLPEDQKLFNTLLAKARIKVEHCIGLLKNRFPCLRGLRTVINEDDASISRIIDRITVCIILHNLLIGSSYPDDWENPVEEDVNNDDIDYEYEEQFVPHNFVDDGANRRMEMMQFILQWNA